MSSHGQHLLQQYLECLLRRSATIDARPTWLGGLELDLYFEDCKFAVEFQGDQHYMPVHGESRLRIQQHNDRQKRKLCEEHGVILLRLDAIDLEYTILNRKLKPYWTWPTPDKKRLKFLNRIATQYRELIREKFGSPTAHRKKKGARRRAAARWHEMREGRNNFLP